MSKNLIFLALIGMLASCSIQKPLYTWGDYEPTSYNYLRNSDEKSMQKLIENYQKIIENQKGSRGIPPPGVCADYGFILLQGGNAEEGREMLRKEIALYPESKIFIDRVLKMSER
jgi:hypothetical protein